MISFPFHVITLVFMNGPAVESEIRNSIVNLENLRDSFEKDAQDRYARICRKRALDPEKAALTDEDREGNRIVPIRDESFVCPFKREYVTEKLGERAFDGVELEGYAAFEALNFVDGKRSVWDIARRIGQRMRLQIGHLKRGRDPHSRM